MSIDPQALVALIQGAGRLVGLKELIRAGGIHPGAQTELKRVLRELVRDGTLERDGKRYGVPNREYAKKSGPAWPSGGKRPNAKSMPPPPQKKHESRAAQLARPASKGQRIEGIIHHHRDGFAFVKPLTGKGEDYFVPREEAARALDHDRVVIELIPGRDGRPIGRVVDVTQRTRQLVIGVYAEEEGEGYVTPREAELGRISVPLTQLARPGDLVKVRLGVGEKVLRKHDVLTGEVAGSLGTNDDHSVEVLSVAFSKGFQDEFPPEVMDEADTFALEVTEDEARGEKRRDLRSMALVTIDGEDARDFDDAIYVEDVAQGWRLVVAIADVSHYVKQGSPLDVEALRRATSVYLPGRVLPMLPERLSNGICSLKPREDRLCMVADMVIDRSGKTVSSDVYPGVMCSQARCTYTEVHRVLNGERVPGRSELEPLFRRANELAMTLTKMRIARGALEFDLPETRVELDPHGLPARMVRRERWESHRLVEECMLAANEAVARYFHERSQTTVNRFHGEPDEDKLYLFTQLLGAYGVDVKPGRLDSTELNAVLKKLDGHPEQRALNQLALRSMMQAVYSASERGHYGLGATDYLHFTSPIRRYPDLLVHRLLKEFWSRGKKVKGKRQEQEDEQLQAMASQSSERERAAMQVEREVNSLYACLLMKDRVGERFPATVSGLSDSGFFVELNDIFVEGLVKGETVFPRFEFDETTYRMTFGDGRVVKVGAKLEVQLTSVNLKRKQMDFVALSFVDAAGPRTLQKREAHPKAGPKHVQRINPVEAGPKRRDDRSSPKRSGGGEKPPKRGGGGFKVHASKPEPRAKHGGHSAPPERTRHVEAAPPKKHAEPAAEAPEGGKAFDPRAVLDRLWRERGGKSGGGAPKPSRDGDKKGRGRR